MGLEPSSIPPLLISWQQLTLSDNMSAFWNAHDNTRKYRTTQAELKQNGNRGLGILLFLFCLRGSESVRKFFHPFQPPVSDWLKLEQILLKPKIIN
jgi:hypothetical protein